MQRDLNPDRLDDGARAEAEMKEREAIGPELREHLNKLRLTAFRTNAQADREAYCAALSKAFQNDELVPAALPAPQGDDTLVAEIEAGLDRYWDLANAEGREGRTHDTPDGDAQETRAKIIAGYRSQAERIAELEASHAAARENFHTMQNAANKLRIAKEAAESLLAEAREALEEASAQILHDYRTWVADDAAAKPRYGQIPRYDAVNATLSRLKPGEKGGE